MPEENVTLTCKHSHQGYDTILWYQRTHKDTNLKLISNTYYGNSKYENNEGNFTVTGDGRSSVTLQISKAREALHSALYLCAAYYTQKHICPLPKTKTVHSPTPVKPQANTTLLEWQKH